MPRIRKAKQALVAADRLVHALHPSNVGMPVSANGSASGRITLGSPTVDEAAANRLSDRFACRSSFRPAGTAERSIGDFQSQAARAVLLAGESGLGGQRLGGMMRW